MRNLSLALVLSFPIVALANGQCSTRPTSAAEQKFHADISAKLRAALPRAPGGWQAVPPPEYEALERVCVGPPVPISAEAAAELQVSNIAEVDSRMQAKAAEAGAELGEAMDDPRVKAAQQRIEELSAKMGAAAERSDMREVQRLQAELEKATAAMSATSNAPIEQSHRRSAEAGDAARDTSARVSILSNSLSHHLGEARPLKLAGRAAHQGRKSGYSQSRGWEQAVYVVLLGKWNIDGLSAEALGMSGGSTLMRNIVVRIQADEARAEELARAVNWASLQSLLTSGQ